MLDHVFGGVQNAAWSSTTPVLLDPLSPEYPALTRKGTNFIDVGGKIFVGNL